MPFRIHQQRGVARRSTDFIEIEHGTADT
jgi:hypothetical protein